MSDSSGTRTLQIMLGAGLLGLTGVAAGTFGAHGLKSILSESMRETFEIGVRYHLIHAACTLALVALVAIWPRNNWLSRAGWLWVLGVTLFSGSLYGLVVFDMPRLGWITPFGGVAFLAGWVCVGIAALREFRMSKHEAQHE